MKMPNSYNAAKDLQLVATRLSEKLKQSFSVASVNLDEMDSNKNGSRRKRDSSHPDHSSPSSKTPFSLRSL